MFRRLSLLESKSWRNFVGKFNTLLSGMKILRSISERMVYWNKFFQLTTTRRLSPRARRFISLCVSKKYCKRIRSISCWVWLKNLMKMSVNPSILSCNLWGKTIWPSIIGKYSTGLKNWVELRFLPMRLWSCWRLCLLLRLRLKFERIWWLSTMLSEKIIQNWGNTYDRN